MNLPDNTYCSYLKDLFLKLDNVHSMAHERILKAKEKSKKFYDRKTNPRLFREGNEVYSTLSCHTGVFRGKASNFWKFSRLMPEIRVCVAIFFRNDIYKISDVFLFNNVSFRP